MKDLDRILTLTDAIEDKVAAGDWAGAAVLDGERQALLVRAVAAPDLVVDRGTREILEQLLARNHATIARIRAARRELDAAARQLAAAPAAMASYGRNGAAFAAGGELP